VDIHNAHPFKGHDIVAQVVAHAPDLPVEALSEHDAEGLPPDFFHLTLFGHGAQDGNALAHPPDKGSVDGLIDGYDIFFFVLVLLAQDFVDDVAVVGQKNQPGGSFVEAADVEDALRVVEEVDDVGLILAVSGAGDAGRLVEGEVDRFGFSFEGRTIQQDLIAGIDAVAFRAVMPFSCTRPASIIRSASRREQMPVELMNLLRLMEGSDMPELAF